MEENRKGEQEISSFSELGLGSHLLAAIETLEWERPTPIQMQAIPAALRGRDLVGIAQTGTGKTGAFVIPILERIAPGGGLQALVLCPTRELAQQVTDDAAALARGSSLRTGAVYGGVRYEPQIRALKEGVEILVATPGRFIDHLRRGNVDLSGVRILVLDEADRMLDMGFRPQIEEVIREISRERQTMLISATMPRGVHALALQVTRDPLWVEAAPSGTTAEGITERLYSVRPDRKIPLLIHLLGDPGWSQVLVFTRTKAEADTVNAQLEKASIPSEVLHSDRQMRHRVRALDRFATQKVRVLVATDIAQRGLDVEGITHVVNYDPPVDPEDYVHRVGRTARAGAVGTAVTFVSAQDLGYAKAIEHRLGRSLERVHLPEFDYAGASVPRDTQGRAHSRGGIGSKSDEELTPEQLKDLLRHD
jgi:ATP-dependent RNA helicase RhlE